MGSICWRAMSGQPLDARPQPPGAIIRLKLDELGWSQRDLAAILGCPPASLSELIRGEKALKPEMAILLAAVFEDKTPEEWLELEAAYRLGIAQSNPRKGSEKIGRRKAIYSKAPVGELIKRGWINKAKGIDKLEKEVCSFLGIKKIEEAPALPAHFRRSPVNDPKLLHQLGWVKRVERLARQQKPYIQDFDLDELKQNIPAILSLTEKEDDIALMPEILLGLGIHFIVVPHLSKTYIDGAYFWVEGNPVVAVTLRYDRIDSFWFTVLHELGHVVSGHEEGSLDNLDRRNGKESSPTENEANAFAKENILPNEEYESFVDAFDPYFSRRSIVELASEIKRHPGIILGRLQWDGLVPYKNLRALLVKVSPFLENWRDVAFPVEWR